MVAGVSSFPRGGSVSFTTVGFLDGGGELTGALFGTGETGSLDGAVFSNDTGAVEVWRCTGGGGVVDVAGEDTDGVLLATAGGDVGTAGGCPVVEILPTVDPGGGGMTMTLFVGAGGGEGCFCLGGDLNVSSSTGPGRGVLNNEVLVKAGGMGQSLPEGVLGMATVLLEGFVCAGFGAFLLEVGPCGTSV